MAFVPGGTGDLVSALRAREVALAVEMLPAALGAIRRRSVQPFALAGPVRHLCWRMCPRWPRRP